MSLSVKKARSLLEQHKSAKAVIGMTLRVHTGLSFEKGEAIAEEIAVALIRGGKLVPEVA